MMSSQFIVFYKQRGNSHSHFTMRGDDVLSSKSPRLIVHVLTTPSSFLLGLCGKTLAKKISRVKNCNNFLRNFSSYINNSGVIIFKSGEGHYAN